MIVAQPNEKKSRGNFPTAGRCSREIKSLRIRSIRKFDQKKRTTELYEFRPISLRGAYDAFSFRDQSHISNRGRLIVFNGFKQLQRREIKFPAVSLVNRNLMAIRRICIYRIIHCATI